MSDDVNGWVRSADAWIASIGADGDWTRRTFLDDVMLRRALAAGGDFLDIGCGEGRFSRMLKDRGLRGVGIDPVPKFIESARAHDPEGEYSIGYGENLDFEDDIFDLTISYLSLIDIEDYRAAINEMARVTCPEGSLLIANLSSYFTAGKWDRSLTGAAKSFQMDDYSSERATREKWSGIDILNWHRPLAAYMNCFLSNDLELVHFSEPIPPDNNDPKSDRYSRVPGFVVMEWKKPL